MDVVPPRDFHLMERFIPPPFEHLSPGTHASVEGTRRKTEEGADKWREREEGDGKYKRSDGGNEKWWRR